MNKKLHNIEYTFNVFSQQKLANQTSTDMLVVLVLSLNFKRQNGHSPAMKTSSKLTEESPHFLEKALRHKKAK